MPTEKWNLVLSEQQDTERLGRMLASILSQALSSGAAAAPLLPLLLDGALGAGKTTLSRAFVTALPDSDKAEFSSPSFNIYNLYPTIPPVAHADLYRLPPGGAPDEELLELMEDGKTLLIMEWAERLPEKLLPPDRLHLTLSLTSEENTKRRAEFVAYGEKGAALLSCLRQMFHS